MTGRRGQVIAVGNKAWKPRTAWLARRYSRVRDRTEAMANEVVKTSSVPIERKLEKVLQENQGHGIFKEVSLLVRDEGDSSQMEGHEILEISSFRYAPSVSVDEERSFSRKKIL